MSALTDLFTAMANKIRSKTGTATTYTPLQMVSDGIDDVYAAGYDAGGGGAAGIPITPSNASPVNLTTGDSYEMLADGYAISSYTNVTPSNSSPVSLTNNTIYKTGGAGVAIASYSSVTPSDSSPVSLSSGAIYKMGGAGKAVASVTDATPSNSSPVSLSSGSIYKMGGAGYAIYSYGNVTPSASVQTLSSGSIYKMNGAGYVYNGTRYANGWNSETTLWTNSAPTDAFAANQEITLSSGISNYKFIKVYWKIYKTETDIYSFIIEKDVIIATGSTKCRMTMGGYYNNNNY